MTLRTTIASVATCALLLQPPASLQVRLKPDATGAPLHGFADYVERARAEWRVPGVAVAIVKDDSLVFAKGYGVRTLGDESALVNERTVFAIGSVTKSFTAASLA